MAALRDEVASDLRDAGPRGERLGAFDAIVRAAMDDAVPGLCKRLMAASEAPFVSALAAAIRSLPAAVDEAALAPWFAERGVLGAHVARTSAITRALLACDARALEALVDAACEGGEA